MLNFSTTAKSLERYGIGGKVVKFGPGSYNQPGVLDFF